MLLGVVVVQVLESEVPGDTYAAGGHVADVRVDDNALLNIGDRDDQSLIASHEGCQAGQQLVNSGLGINSEQALDVQQELLYLCGRSQELGGAFQIAGEAALVYPVSPQGSQPPTPQSA